MDFDFLIEPIYFPLQFYFFESSISLSAQKLQEILCDTGVDSCVQMIRDRLMSCSILFYTFEIWSIL